VPVNKDLKARFGFKPGSYWIYRDSVTGETDSAYVYSTQTNYMYKGCLLYSGEPEFEYNTVFVRVARNNGSLDSERWNFNMEESSFNMACVNSADRVESQLSFNLFNWPFITGAPSTSGCVLPPDVSVVTNVVSPLTLAGQTYSNLARSNHVPGVTDSSLVYNDFFYVSEDVGIVKLVFDHPTIPVHRVLELQRSHIIR